MYSISLSSLFCPLSSSFQHLLIIPPYYFLCDILSNFCKIGSTSVISAFFSVALSLHIIYYCGFLFYSRVALLAENFSRGELFFTKICSARNRANVLLCPSGQSVSLYNTFLKVPYMSFPRNRSMRSEHMNLPVLPWEFLSIMSAVNKTYRLVLPITGRGAPFPKEIVICVFPSVENC